MPHIKVAPFPIEELDRRIGTDPVYVFRAAACDAEHNNREQLGICFEGEAFVIEIHKRGDDWLIKPDKATRPLDVNRIKRALRYLAESSGWKIRHHNITISSSRPLLAEAFNKQIDDFESPDFGGRPVATCCR